MTSSDPSGGPLSTSTKPEFDEPKVVEKYDSQYESDDDGFSKKIEFSEARSRMWSPPMRKYVPVEVVGIGYFFSVIFSAPLIQFYIVEQLTREYSTNVTNNNPCDPEGSNSTDSALQQKIQSEAATYTMGFLFTISFPGIIQIFLFGALTDRQGRRGSVFLALGGILVRIVVYLIVFQLDLPLEYLFIGNALDGLTGNFGLMLTAVFGMVADITAPGKKRAIRIIVLQTCMALSTTLGALTSGVWIEAAGFKQPVYFLAALVSTTLLFAIFFLPETRIVTDKEPVSLLKHLKSMKRCFQLYTKDTPDKRRWKLLVSLFTFLSSFSVQLTLGTTLLLYLLATPFCWDKIEISGYGAGKGFIGWISIFLLTKLCLRYFSEIIIAIIGCVSSTLFLLCIGLADTYVIVIIAAAVGIFSEAAPPMMRSVMSRLVSQDEQGALFASISAVEMLATTVVGVIGPAVYKASLFFFPGLVFIILAFLTLVTALLLGALWYGIRKESRKSEMLVVNAPEREISKF